MSKTLFRKYGPKWSVQGIAKNLKRKAEEVVLDGSPVLSQVFAKDLTALYLPQKTLVSFYRIERSHSIGGVVSPEVDRAYWLTIKVADEKGESIGRVTTIEK